MSRMSPLPRHGLLAACILILAFTATSAASAQASVSPVRPARAALGLYRTTVILRQPRDDARLEKLGAVPLTAIPATRPTTAIVLVDGAALDDLARLRFEPQVTDELGDLLKANSIGLDGLGSTVQQLLSMSAKVEGSVRPKSATLDSDLSYVGLEGLRESLRLVAPGERAELAALAADDDDSDGLTNTQEAFWCTNAQKIDSDGDGASDWEEVRDAKDWLGNRRGGPPSTGKPFSGWPATIAGCVDDDKDSLPDMAERWELGLNLNWESTDRDKFDDGQELFGGTYCPGSAAYCGYGALPRNEDWGVVTAAMPSWVRSSGNHPMVAAFPVPEISVADSSFKVTVITEISTDHTITEGSEHTYTTSETDGQSTGVADATTWNSWEEVSVSKPLSGSSALTEPVLKSPEHVNELSEKVFLNINGRTLTNREFFNCLGDFVSLGLGCAGTVIDLASGIHSLWSGTPEGEVTDGVCLLTSGCAPILGIVKLYDALPTIKIGDQTGKVQAGVQKNILDRPKSYSGTLKTVKVDPATGTTTVTGRQAIPFSYPIPNPVPIRTETKGSSRGGSHTVEHTTYKEYTTGESNAFSDAESWGDATATNSAKAAQLTFRYFVRNTGTEYAREVGDVAFSIYVGDDPNPIATHLVADDIHGDGLIHNLMPGDERSFTANPTDITLDQLRAIDTGSPIRIVVEAYTYGVDQLFYQDAIETGVAVSVDDGVDDGDQAIDWVVIPSWGSETNLDVLTRYFPNETDGDGQVIAIYTSERRADAPEWCLSARRVGDTLWCRKGLSVADWWNIYTRGVTAQDESLDESSAKGGSMLFLRFNRDQDLDGYSDRSELLLGTVVDDKDSRPDPQLVAGLNTITSGQVATSTISLANTGLYDAYGIRATMIAPNPSISLTNNVVGGAGRVRAASSVVVGSQIAVQGTATGRWSQSGHARPATSGYYTGNVDRHYAFTVSCNAPESCDVGSGTWALNWSDSLGTTGSLDYGMGYRSPEFLAVGQFGVQLALYGLEVKDGESFTVDALTPRDTFEYRVTQEPHTPPIVVVSYNDPQGDHRFVTAVNIVSPTASLSAYGDEMLRRIGIDIVATQPITVGSNALNLEVRNPTNVEIESSHFMLEFIDITGTLRAETQITTTVHPGPQIITVPWDTTSFSPAFSLAEPYSVVVFWTDWHGSVIDVRGRPLWSFQADPKPTLTSDTSALTWNIGTVAQGTTVKRRITLSNTGFGPLQTWIDTPVGLTISAAGVSSVAPGDSAVYDLALNTQQLPVGPYSQTIAIRTSDPSMGNPALVVIGMITSPPSDVPEGALAYAMDYDLNVTGNHSVGEQITFTHNLGPSPVTLHPIKVNSQNRSTVHGVGKYATAFAQGVPTSVEMFGNGQDGDLTVGSNGTTTINSTRVNVTASGTSAAPSNSTGFAVGDIVLFYQVRNTSDEGRWEFAEIQAINSATDWTLKQALAYSFNNSSGKAQVIKVPRYRNVTINSSGTLNAPDWDGNTGGVLAFKASGSVTLNGTVSVSGKGFRGGNGGHRINENNSDRHGYQGEGRNGTGGHSSSSNDSGGGAGMADFYAGDGGGGGGGGSHASSGTNGTIDQSHQGQDYGRGATVTYGDVNLGRALFGGGAGGGGSDDALGAYGGGGGAGGGLVLLYGQSVSGGGTVTAAGGVGVNGTGDGQGGGGGGGGAGGAVALFAGTLSGSLNATGGSAGSGCCGSGNGGAGGGGRIRVEYCETNSSSANPTASTQKLSCFLTEQIETSPYTGASFQLPETFTNGRHYWIQYGRKLTYNASGQQTTTLRISAGALSSAVIDVLVSGVPANGSVNAKLSIGDLPGWDWDTTLSANSSGAVSFTTVDLAAAFSAYWASHGGVPPANVDVPVRVYLNQAGQILLTNLQTTASASKLRKVRLAARTYTTVDADVTVGASGSGPLRIYADVGDNGTVDWTYSGTVAFPAQLATTNLAAAFNAYLSGESGEVDVPIRFYVSPNLAINLTDFTAVSTAQPDVTLAASDIGFSSIAPVEGDAITVTATLHNLGTNFSGPVTAAFYGTLSDGREWYIGSALVAEISPGGTATASIQWRSAGFYGDDLPVRVAVDPYDRVDEAVEDNNSASKTITILFNSDLHLSPISNVRFSNVNDGRFVVSWLTDVPLDGRIKLYVGGGSVRYLDDNRGGSTVAKTHYVSVDGLDPSTNYSFDVLSDQFVDHNQTQHYSVMTGPALSPRAADTVHGRVLMADGFTPMPDAIVHVTVEDYDGLGSSGQAKVLSTLTNVNGLWSIDLADARATGLGTLFTYSASGDRVRVEAITEPRAAGCLVADTADDAPTPDLVLGVSECSREVQLTLRKGWNLISLPVEPSPSLTAEGLCTTVNSHGGSAVEVDRWIDSSWEGHVCGLPFENFKLSMGSAYFVKVSADSMWHITGTVSASGVPLALSQGWSTIGVPHSARYTAETLCSELNRVGTPVQEIDRWFRGGWQGNVCGLALEDFSITPGEGYLVRTQKAGMARPAASPPESAMGASKPVGALQRSHGKTK